MRCLFVDGRRQRKQPVHQIGSRPDSYDISSRWNIEVEAKPSLWNSWGAQKYDILPHGEETGLFHTHNDAPNFTWRKQFDPYR
jgi:hypothetical protein